MPAEVHREGHGPLVLTCEHASNRLPDGVTWGADAWLAETHWAWDPGAAGFTRDLARTFRSRAVLSRFSRLWIDPNRDLESPTLFRELAEGRRVQLNASLDEATRRSRIDGWWRPYHAAIDRLAGEAPAKILVSVHSFTPEYEGSQRDVEIGVLYDRDEELAGRFADALAGSGFDVRHNEPYSGKGGMMYACERHASAHGLGALEIELRQDLLADNLVRPRLLRAVETALGSILA